MSEVFAANQGGGVKEAAVRGGLPPAFGADAAFNLRIAEAFRMIPPFDIAPRARQNPVDRLKPRDPGPRPKFDSPGRSVRNPSSTSTPTENPSPPTIARAPKYLGTAEKAPIIEIVEASTPWFTDEGGSEIPTDDLFAGQTATVTLVTNHFNQSTLDRILSRPNPVSGTAGRNSAREFGELAGLERGGFILYVVFPNARTDAYSRDGEVMPDGYRFWFAKLLSSQIIPGTQAKKAALRFVCRQAWQATRHSSPETHAPVERNAIEAVLFDYDISAVAA